MILPPPLLTTDELIQLAKAIDKMDDLLGTCHAVLGQVATWDERWAGTAKYQAATTANAVKDTMIALEPELTLACALLAAIK